MAKMTLKKIIIISIIILSAFIVVQSICFAKKYFIKKANHEKVLELVEKNNNLSELASEEYADKINNMIINGTYNNGDLGLLYEHAGLVYNQLGEEMTYYRYLGYALYYLENSEEKDYTVSVYLDLANLHIYNHASASADELIKRAMDIEPFEEISDMAIKARSYQVLALLQTDKQKYDNAIDYLKQAQEYIDSMDASAPYIDDIIKINKINLAKAYVYSGQLDECESILEQFNDYDFSEVPKNTQELTNFYIPYYQTRCILTFSKNPDILSDKVAEDIDSFVKLCQNNGYERIALDTLLRLQDTTAIDNEVMQKMLSIHVNALSKEIIKDDSNTHSTIINNQVNDSRLSMEMSSSITQKTQKRTMLIIISFVIICLIILLFILIILNSKRDGLTFLYNRRTFNYDIESIKRFKIHYAVIMLDIDNFKHINDTYGHPEGDKVLQKLGQLISSVAKNNADIRGYRYGGEEFTIITSRNSLSKTLEIAETLRHNMAATTWSFDPELMVTISLGVAFSSSTDDVVKKADENLYYSKQHGKNQLYAD